MPSSTIKPSAIEPGRLLTGDEARRVKAALALADLNQKSYAAEYGVSYDRLNRMVARVEAVTPSYADRLNRLVTAQFGTAFSRLAA